MSKLKLLSIFLCVALPALANPGTIPWKVSQQERNCLAQNIYHEARGETYLGKLAVAKVTINRTKHRQFPQSICRVVYQSGQFTWTKKYNPRTDSDSLYIAHIALTGEHELKTFDALYFHNKSVKPKWKLKRVATIGSHIFYKNYE